MAGANRSRRPSGLSEVIFSSPYDSDSSDISLASPKMAAARGKKTTATPILDELIAASRSLKAAAAEANRALLDNAASASRDIMSFAAEVPQVLADNGYLEQNPCLAFVYLEDEEECSSVGSGGSKSRRVKRQQRKGTARRGDTGRRCRLEKNQKKKSIAASETQGLSSPLAGVSPSIRSRYQAAEGNSTSFLVLLVEASITSSVRRTRTIRARSHQGRDAVRKDSGGFGRRRSVPRVARLMLRRTNKSRCSRRRPG